MSATPKRNPNVQSQPEKIPDNRPPGQKGGAGPPKGQPIKPK